MILSIITKLKTLLMKLNCGAKSVKSKTDQRQTIRFRNERNSQKADIFLTKTK